MRLSKFLSLSVAMSRNQAKFFIRKGRVSASGNVVTDPNFELADNSDVIFDGKPISIAEYKYVLMHKPASYACTANHTEYTSVLKLLKNRSESRYYYFANVLGPELTGLVLLSDDARWTSRMRRKLFTKTSIYEIRSKNIVSKEQLQKIKKMWVVPSESQAAQIIDIQKQNEKTVLLTTNRPQIQEMMDLFPPADLAIEAIHLKQLGKLSLGDLTEVIIWN